MKLEGRNIKQINEQKGPSIIGAKESDLKYKIEEYAGLSLVIMHCPIQI